MSAPEPELSPPSPPPAPPGRLTELRDAPAPIVVPARGYLFAFRVHTSFVWSSEGLPRETLNGCVKIFIPYAIRALTRLAAARARNVAAHQAEELEVELQRTIDAFGPLRYEYGEARVDCQACVSVELDDRVKQAVQPYWEQLIRLDCEYDVDTKRAQYIARMSRQWSTILEDLLDNPVAGGAATLSNQALAAVVRDFLAARKAEADQLADRLAEYSRNGAGYEQSAYFDLLMDKARRNGSSSS
ncbi:hypothetical protein O7632_20445 [Solwaraspora sp. WMMD406]|uniref:hypothetical protein n=1 Tax=Solwaraspora sp. WMMD406 TaxID=3016095 RepID=UPI002416012C|nr:hypothetical protein [Solwaraspora sp. WMMD406]MDG4766451.1 hypothetical protein [Solwaraspora sp. WMMD406]